MKILVISNIFPPGFIGGYELGAFDVTKKLFAAGHDILVLTSDYFVDKYSVHAELNVSRTLNCDSLSHEIIRGDIVSQLYYSFRNIRVIGSSLRQFDPDVVLTFNLMGLGVLSIIQYLQKLRIPSVIYLMDNIFSGLDIRSPLHKLYEKTFGKFLLDDSTGIISMSKVVSDEVGANLGIELKNVTYVPGWVDFDPSKKTPIFPRANGVTNFVFCSRVAQHKGIDIVIDSVDYLVNNGHKNFHVDIYGAGQVSSVLQRVKAKDLDDYISYQGLLAKDEMLPRLNSYDSLVFPTWEREPFGFVASEAAVAGCYPIMTGGIGASEWFLDGHDCFKISRTCESLSDAMLQVILWSEEELLQRRIVTQNGARKNFIFDRWFSVIEKVCFDACQHKRLNPSAIDSQAAESAFLYLNTLFSEAR